MSMAACEEIMDILKQILERLDRLESYRADKVIIENFDGTIKQDVGSNGKGLISVENTDDVTITTGDGAVNIQIDNADTISADNATSIQVDSVDNLEVGQLDVNSVDHIEADEVHVENVETIEADSVEVENAETVES